MSMPVLCLMGPTASGKSALALQLAEVMPCELISVDSTLVYQGMDIGSAKPTVEQQAKVPHHLLDICPITTPYSAAQFCQDAQDLIVQIQQRGRLPLLVGGTCLYFRALLRGLSALPTANASVRAQLAEQAEQHGWPALHQQLQRLDSVAAARIQTNDAQRIMRALEVYQLTGRPLSQHWQQPVKSLPWSCVQIGLMPSDRLALHQIIAQRFKQMLADGFYEEVEQLFAQPNIDSTLPALKAVGYRQLGQHVLGQLSWQQACDKAVVATRQLAKRQMTWLRHWPDLFLIDSQQAQLVDRVIDHMAKAGFCVSMS